MSLQVVILAGGLATRMLPHTATTPKALLPVMGKPFADWQLGLLSTQGVHDVVYCVGHLGEQIEQAIGDGSRWGISVSYSYEKGGLLGTGGALRLALDRGLLDETSFVLYGDSYLPITFAAVEQAYQNSQKPALMTVVANDGQLGTSNACLQNGLVTLYKKGCGSTTDMDFIDFGLSALRTRLIQDHVDPGRPQDLADVFHELSLAGSLAGYETRSRFYEIGSREGLVELEGYLSSEILGPSASSGSSAPGQI